MRTLIVTSMIVLMALAIVCMTAPLGRTQGVETSIGKCPPGATDRLCVDIKNFGSEKPAWTIPESHYAEQPTRAFGQCPAWSADGVCISKPTVCHECGQDFPVYAGIKELENEPELEQPERR